MFLRPRNKSHPEWDDTVIGRAWFTGEQLLVETNSVQRADALRKAVERVAGARVQHHLREQRGAEAMMRAVIHEMLERYDSGRIWTALGLDPAGETGAVSRRAPRTKRTKVSSPATTEARPRGAIAVLELTVTIRHVEPRIWRRLRVRANTTLAVFHDVLQAVMGWTDSHLHLFRAGGIEYGVRDPEMPELRSEKRVQLGSLLLRPGDRLVYEYDFGDSWEHDIELERTLPPDPGPGKYPYVIAGARACPPEDCGGAHGYEGLLHVLADRRDPEHKSVLEWVGRSFGPEAFDASAINGTFHRSWAPPQGPPRPRR